MEFETVKTPRLFEEISRQIRGQIHSGQLKPGERLPNERDLANAFAVSRHAVREALRSLESIGQLELRKGAAGGAFVTSGNPQPLTKIMRGMFEVGGISLAQLTEARLAVESAVIAVACEKADAGALAALEANIAAAERETLAGNLAAKTRLNVQFHILLAELTRNPVLVMTMTSLMNILLDFINEVGSVMGVDVIQSRRRFLEHMRASDCAGATDEMQSHLRLLHRHYLEASSHKTKKEGDANVG